MATNPPLPTPRTDPDGSAVIRVLTYNIRSMRDDTTALARVITACAPDLVLIQEAPRFFRWRKKLARLAADSGQVLLSGGAPAAGPRSSVPSARQSNAPRTSFSRSPPATTAAASPRQWSASGAPGSAY